MSIILDGSAGVTTNSGAVYNGISRETVKSATGTEVDFTPIPSWVKRITLMFNGVRTNGASNTIVQLGDSGGIESTGYLSGSRDTTITSAGGGVGSTSGFVMAIASANYIVYGTMTIVLIEGTSWIS